MSLKVSWVILVAVLSFFLGAWEALHPSALYGNLDHFEKWVVARVHGTPQCPEGYICKKD